MSAEGVYNGFYQWNHRRNVSVGDSIGESATSLYGYLGLNPPVIPLVKSSEKTPRHHTIASFQTNCIGRRYIQTGSPTELCCRYIPTELKTELFPSVRITDEKFSSVIPLVFAGFLVMMDCILLMTITRPISKEHMAKKRVFI